MKLPEIIFTFAIIINSIITIVSYFIHPKDTPLFSFFSSDKQYKVSELVHVRNVYFLYLIVPFLIIYIILYLQRVTSEIILPYVLGFYTSHSIIFSSVSVLKNFVAEKRPDYYARLKFNDAHMLVEGKRSFPSGHSAYSFCGATFVSIFIYFRVIKYYKDDRKNQIFGKVGMSLFCLSALFVSISRVMDNRHFAHDVIFGGLLGVIVSIIMYSVVKKIVNKRENEPLSVSEEKNIPGKKEEARNQKD